MQEKPFVIHRRRNGTIDDPFSNKLETLKLDSNAKVILSELPNETQRIKVSSDDGVIWSEIQKGTPNETQFIVDYDIKMVMFHLSNAGKQLTFEYMGEGLSFVSVDQIYTNEENGVVTETLGEFIETSRQEIDELQKLSDEIEIAENERVDSEDEREANESDRKLKESDRVSEETVRRFNESARLINEENRKIAENTRETQESIRNDNEITRKSEESVRVSNESTRDSAEQIRVSNENVRLDAEGVRETSENTRSVNEAIRESNEDIRQSQESKRQTDTSNALSLADEKITELQVKIDDADSQIADKINEIDLEGTNAINTKIDELDNTFHSNLTQWDSDVDVKKTEVDEKLTEVNNQQIAWQVNEQNRVEAEDNRNLTESLRQSTEDSRNLAEQQRIIDENLRTNAELIRSQLEEARKSNEQIRINNETTRDSAETIRQQQESQRQIDTQIAIDETNLATQNANESASNADTKAQLAQEKADLASASSVNANENALLAKEKALLADEKATLANNNAQYAQTQGDYAKQQGDAIQDILDDGTVASVNGQTGAVVLDADDVGAYTKSETDGKIAQIVDSAPETLNTLQELASALGDDPNFATTVSNQIGSKIDKSEKGVVGGVAELNINGQVIDANGNLVEGKVKSVNSKTGDVSLTHVDVGASPANHTHSELHTHSNKAVLDGLTDNSGQLRYNGTDVGSVTSVNGMTGDVIVEVEDEIIQQDTEPTGVEEGRLWLDTSDNTYQGTMLEEIESKIGNPSSLLTVNKTNIVGAINELFEKLAILSLNDISSLSASLNSNYQIELSWINPTDDSYVGVVIYFDYGEDITNFTKEQLKYHQNWTLDSSYELIGGNNISFGETIYFRAFAKHLINGKTHLSRGVGSTYIFTNQ